MGLDSARPRERFMGFIAKAFFRPHLSWAQTVSPALLRRSPSPASRPARRRRCAATWEDARSKKHENALLCDMRPDASRMDGPATARAAKEV